MENIIEEPVETDLNLDQPGENELGYEMVFGSSETPDEVLYHPPHILNQGKKAKTRMACTRYGICHAINAMNEFVNKHDFMRYMQLNPDVYWDQYLKINPSAESQGATLQSALEQFKELGFITGYTRLGTIVDMKSALNACRPIYTGSSNGDWNYVRDTKSYRLRTDGKVIGHCFCIVGFDRLGWVAINSYGENNGVFVIPYELTSTLFSRYALHDTRDEEVLSRFI